MVGRDALMYGILVVLFGGVIYPSRGLALVPDIGYWFVVVGLVVGVLGLSKSLLDELSK